MHVNFTAIKLFLMVYTQDRPSRSKSAFASKEFKVLRNATVLYKMKLPVARETKRHN